MSRALCLAVVLVVGACGAVAASEPDDNNRSTDEVPVAPSVVGGRDLIAKAAAAQGLPILFFSRLIWQESRFDPDATSQAGAQGIAQFMPQTARWRGLRDPFQPAEALAASARWLRDLWVEFGNLGLAAAAYNAGPHRVRRWLNGRATLPAETRAYVQIVTGNPVAAWTKCGSRNSDDCVPLADPPPAPTAAPRRSMAARGVWGLQLIGERSAVKALSQYRGLQSRFPNILGDRRPLVLARKLPGRGSATWYQVRVAEGTRERADDLCTRLKQFGGACVVLRN